MSVYRERRRSRSALWVGIGIGVGLGVVLIGLLIFLRPTQPPADRLAGARAKASEAAQGLEVFTIEYPQAAQGAELAGARGALERAEADFDSAKVDLAQLDSGLVDDIAADFKSLKGKVEALAPADEVLLLAEATRGKLLKLVSLEEK